MCLLKSIKVKDIADCFSNDTRYRKVEVKDNSTLEKYNIKEFGGLINTQTPIHVKPDGVIHNMIARKVKMDGETEDYTVSGALLNNAGIKLKQAFGGTGFDDETRLFKDFSSRMYFIESV